MPVALCERLTFDRLFRISEPKRVYRSFTVKGPPLEIDSYQNAAYYIYSFKANPSTTGLRHKGYVKFFKPKLQNPKNVPLQHLECLVDCTCPDFRYRWAWANKQRQSSQVGPQSLNQAWNKAPRKTNPKGTPGLCKHILATRQFIYGLLSSFPGDQPDTAAKLDRLTKYATKRWTDFDGQMRAAKEREREIRRRRELRNIGQLPVAPPAPPVAPEPEEPEEKPASVDAPQRTPKDQKPKTTADLKKERPPKLPSSATPTSSPTLAIPPSERGRQFPTSPPKRVIGNREVNPPKPGDKGWIRPQEAALCEPLRDLILESVVKPNGDIMSNINEAIKLVEEMEADELSHLQSDAPPADMGMGGDVGGDTLEPSEPPISDTAIGADTEGDTALGLLRDMKTSLQQIAAAVAPVEEMPPGDEMGGVPGGAPGGPGGEMGDGAPGGDEIPMPDEPPGDLEDEGAAEAAEGAAEEDEGAAKEDEGEEKEKVAEED